MEGEGEGKKAKFNPGIAAAERLDAQMRAINACRYNLKSFNPDTGTFSYDAMNQAIVGLLMEAWGKLDKKERDEGDKIRMAIEDFIQLNPPMEKRNNKQTQEMVWNEKNLRRLRELLLYFEMRVKDYLEAHDMNNPNKDFDDERW